MKQRLSQQAILIVSVPLAFELLLLGIIGYLLHMQRVESLNEESARRVIGECSTLSSTVVRSGALLFTGLLGSPDTTKLGAQLRESRDLLDVNLQNLRRLPSRSHSEALEKVDINVNQIKLLLTQPASQESSLTWINRARRLRPLISKLEDSLQSLIEAEHLSLEKSHRRYLLLQKLLEITCCSAFAVSILVALALLIYFRKSITVKVETLKANSQRLAVGDVLLPQLRGTDEFVELDSSFRDMAYNLQLVTAQRKELLQMVAHDLRSPLSAMLVTLQIMETGKRGPLTAQLSQDVTLLSTNAERLVRMIGDLLNVEAIEGGATALEKKRCSLVKIISRAVDEVQALACSKEILIDVPEDAPMAFVDEERIIQVLVNLLSNAIKFSPEKSHITVTCTAKIKCNDGFWNRISILDQGRGIPPDKIGKLFRRFSQVNAEDRKQGSGLGLAICKALVTAHGGDIGCENNAKSGANFWLLLPALSE